MGAVGDTVCLSSLHPPPPTEPIRGCCVQWGVRLLSQAKNKAIAIPPPFLLLLSPLLSRSTEGENRRGRLSLPYPAAASGSCSIEYGTSWKLISRSKYQADGTQNKETSAKTGKTDALNQSVCYYGFQGALITLPPLFLSLSS